MDLVIYPEPNRKSIRKLSDRIGVSPETAYAMMLMTATLMDLRPEEDEVVHIILKDCGMEVTT